jgi:hypothetical protein
MRTRIWGFVLLSVTGAALAGAVAVGVAGGLGHIDQATLTRLTVLLAGIGELSFWAGGSLIGLSAARVGGGGFAALRDRVAFWRPGS